MHTNCQHYAYTWIGALFLGCAYKHINSALSRTAYAKSSFHHSFVQFISFLPFSSILRQMTSFLFPVVEPLFFHTFLALCDRSFEYLWGFRGYGPPISSWTSIDKHFWRPSHHTVNFGGPECYSWHHSEPKQCWWPKCDALTWCRFGTQC